MTRAKSRAPLRAILVVVALIAAYQLAIHDATVHNWIENALSFDPSPSVTPAEASAPCVASGPETYDNHFHPICATTGNGRRNTLVYKDEVDFVVVCSPTNRRKSDPILLPGVANENRFFHEHQFIGTEGSATATASSLLATPSNCSIPQNHSLYWAPVLFKADGTPMIPYTSRLYYRVGTMHPENLVTIPQGLEMVAGDMMATGSHLQQPQVAAGYCRTRGKHVDGQTAKQPFPPGSNGSAVCRQGTVLTQSVVFPNCWNGVLRYARSNFAYSTIDGTCPAGMNNIPQLTEEDRYDEDGHHDGERDMYYSAMGSPFTLHADVIESWDQSIFDRLLNDCLKASVHCGDVNATRMPPRAAG